MQRKRFVLLVGSLIFLPFFVASRMTLIRNSPAAIAKARMNANQWLEQMKPETSNFDGLQEKVEGILQGLRNIDQRKIARKLELELDKKVVARKNYLIKKYGKQAEEQYQELQTEKDLVAKLKEHQKAQQERIDAKKARTKQLEDDIEQATADADKYAEIMEEAVKIAANQGWNTQAGKAVIKYLEGQ